MERNAAALRDLCHPTRRRLPKMRESESSHEKGPRIGDRSAERRLSAGKTIPACFLPCDTPGEDGEMNVEGLSNRLEHSKFQPASVDTDTRSSPVSIDVQEHHPKRGPMPSQQAFADALDPSSSFLERLIIIEGPDGSGKTHTLSSAASSARASGHQVIEISGRGDDIVMASASLSALLTLLPQTARPHGSDGRRYGDDAKDSRHVILVDDWQQLDRGAREQLHASLTFLSRTTRTVSVIATSNRLLFPGWDSRRLVSLKPLSTADAEALLARNDVDLPPSRRRMLLRLAAGNPLVLDAIGRAWSAASWESKTTFFPSYPVHQRLVGHAADRLAKLGVSTRASLLVAAVAQAEFGTDLPSAAVRDLADGLREAIRAEIVLPTAERIVFNSPVTRAAVLCLATEAELASARAEVAHLTDSHEYLSLFVAAAAADGCDDDLADRLERGATGCIRSGRPHEATSALLSASRLTSSPIRRSEFLVEAADNAAYLGHFVVVEDAFARVASPAGDSPARLFPATQFTHLVRNGANSDVKRNLLAALSQQPDGEVADRILAVLQMVCLIRGDFSWWDVAVRAGEQRSLDPVLRLVENCLTRNATRIIAAAKESAADGSTWKQISLHVAWSLLDSTDARRAHIDELFTRIEHAEDLPGLLHTYRAATASIQRGAWQHADDLLESARRLAERLGALMIVALVDANRLMLLSMRGEPDRARAAADAATGWAMDNGSPLIARAADHARSAIDLAAGDFEEAFARSAVAPLMNGRWLQSGYGPIVLLDAVEASARMKLPDHGRVLVDAAAALLGEAPPPRQRMILAASRAILDETTDGRELFEAALAAAPAEATAFETARVRLAYGERLRRTMNPLEARAQFRIAAAAFEALGAHQWRLRALRELRAAGGVADRGPSPTTYAVLSQQEREVASLAAQGLSNKQIAHRLYLSPRTVSGHLYRVFPKLGVTSRAGLRDALVGVDVGDVVPVRDQVPGSAGAEGSIRVR
jgi:DNA-binding CsgD family transcriptional regulator